MTDSLDCILGLVLFISALALFVVVSIVLLISQAPLQTLEHCVFRSVIEASNVFGRFLAGQMTAAGKVPPAKVTHPLFSITPLA